MKPSPTEIRNALYSLTREHSERLHVGVRDNPIADCVWDFQVSGTPDALLQWRNSLVSMEKVYEVVRSFEGDSVARAVIAHLRGGE